MKSLEPSTSAHTTHEAIVIGEALIDVVRSPIGTVEHPGGSPMNVAYGLGRLGVNTALMTAIGEDPRGTAIESHLRAAGVTVLPGARSLERTATATAALADDGSASYEFDIEWKLPPLAPAYLPKVLHTGSIATFLQPGASAVKSLLEQSRRGCLVTYDPNIRPALLGSHAEALGLFEDLVSLTDVVKLSDEDAQWLYPGALLEETAARILGLGTGLAVITTGSRGSLLATKAVQRAVPAIPSMVVDTIGAGDSYMAALILGLLNRGTDGLTTAVLDQLGRTASQAAAITVSRRGANPPTLEELQHSLSTKDAVPA